MSSTTTSSSSSVIPVRVAVRFRPLSSKETQEGCRDSVSVLEGKQVVLEPQRTSSFTYDFAFDQSISQESMYESSAQGLVPELFRGYNVTVLAYGQTGSGKTHSMGTTNSPSTPEADLGIIPRVIRDIFSLLRDKESSCSISNCSTKVSFIELYKETLFDLLSSKSMKKEQCTLEIREDPRLGPHIANLTEIPVVDLSETLEALEAGSRKRVTAATAMNNVSSRSHAIFTFHIQWTAPEGEDESVFAAKFHLVDLAGSERQKKTKATGERLKEGIDINRGLLALGNVIAALGEESSSAGHGYKHIPYRDSKLTRLLQDSLGGNSHTLMIACASPSDSNLDETLSTLRYADRARKIKNKPLVNREGKEAEIKKLKSEIAALKAQLSTGGSQDDPQKARLLKEVTERLREENRELTSALLTVQEELTHLNEGIMLTENVNLELKSKLLEFSKELRKGTEDDKLEAVNANIQDLLRTYEDSEKKKAEFEMSHNNSTSLHNKDDNGEELELMDESGSAEDTDASKTAAALRQSHLASELQNLNKLLAQKEHLASAMSDNEVKFSNMKATYEKSISGLEAEIEKMNKEMEELLKAGKKESGVSKISESRRQRIQELETLIQEMKRKLSEQTKAIRLNEKDKDKMKKLSVEILEMKQAKVRLVRQMKENSEKLRVWKKEKERELCQVKQETRKNLVKMTKMENLHKKQQTVWKRKIEEVAAVNARLKSIVDKQKAAKSLKGSSGLSGAGDRVRSFIHDELEVIAGHKEALLAKETLFKERLSLKSQLSHCQIELRSTLSSSERSEIDAKISTLTGEIEERSNGISNLQKTLADLDKVKEVSVGKWEMLSTMTEAKIGLEYLIDQCSSAQASQAILRSEHANALKSNELLSRDLSDLQKKIDRLSSIHEDQMVKQSRDHEEKVLFLLRQFQGVQKNTSSAADVEERLRIQESEINKMSHLNEVLIEMREENEQLHAKLKAKNFVMPIKNPSSKPSSNNASRIIPSVNVIEPETDPEDETSIDERDDISKDPDWKKTPLYNRIRSLKERTMNSSSSQAAVNSGKRKLEMMFEASESDEEKGEVEGGVASTPPKTRRTTRITLPGGCKCKGRCNDGRCSCRKRGKACEDCSCSTDACSNRKSSSPLKDVSNVDGHTLSILNSDESLNGSQDDEEEELQPNPKFTLPKATAIENKDNNRRVSHFNPPNIP